MSHLIHVLFLCTHNSARSQMAEGLLRHFGGLGYEAFSAGTEATSVRPEAVAVMREIGIDIKSQTSKTLHRLVDARFDCVVTVCDAANDVCPYFPGPTRRLHWSIADPAAVQGTPEQRQAAFRRARNELRHRIEEDLLRVVEDHRSPS